MYILLVVFIYLNINVSSFISAGPIGAGSSRIFWGLGPYPAVAVAGLGDSSVFTELEEINGVKENVRNAAASRFPCGCNLQL